VRIENVPTVTLALMLFGASASIARPALADDAPLQGSWKLVLLANGEHEFAIFKVIEKDDKTTATVVDADETLEKGAVKGVERKDGMLTITLTDTTFKGGLVKDGRDAGRFLGTIKFRGGLLPARLETTDKSKVVGRKPSPLFSKFTEIRKESDPKSRIKKLEEAIQGNQGDPINAFFYAELLRSAEAAGLEAEKVADVIKHWTEEAKPYGDEWKNEVRLRALKLIASRKNFAKLTVELAQEADKLLTEEALETKETVVEFLTRAARATGMEELARESEARRAKLGQQLDEEFRRKVPHFTPASYSERQNKKADRVVLMELFTGAQCPPCVAADVGFDALLKTYKPADFIGLQYHLHIPGPDPLTNRGSIARQKYYGSEIPGTPSTFFNGRSEAGGGGSMGDSQEKYNEYRAIIDKSLETIKRANIAVSATRAGGQIKIIASAEVTENFIDQAAGSETSKISGKEKSKEERVNSKRVLRLALTEESIHYVGGNRLRYHHHVVRALPGGADGKELKDGKGKTEVTLTLAELKLDLEKYLSD
jgi:hypothetical protein